VLGGGAVVTDRRDLARKLEGTYACLDLPPILTEIRSFVEVGIYSVLVHPNLYWMPDSLPFVKLGETRYIEDFRVSTMSRYHSALVGALISRNDRMNEVRRERSQYLIGLVGDLLAGGAFAVPGAELSPPYLRLPIVFRSSADRDRIRTRLRDEGIGATAMYGAALHAIPGVSPHLSGLEEYPNAEWMAERLLTVPVGPFVVTEDLDLVARVIGEECA
jgi:hypothetical protein